MTVMSASYSNSGTETMNGHLCVGGLTQGNYLPWEGYFKALGGLVRTVMFFRNDNGAFPNLTTVEIKHQFLSIKPYTKRFTITPHPLPPG